MNLFAGIFFRTQKKHQGQVFADKKIEAAGVLHEEVISNEIVFAAEHSSSLLATDSIAIVGSIDLYNKKTLQNNLGISESTSGIEIALEAYLKWGVDCVNHLYGYFSFAVWDKQAKKLHLFRDHLGHSSMYYYLDDHICMFSNSINPLSIFSFSKKLNDAWIRKFVLGNFTSEDRGSTIFETIKKLLPAHAISISATEVANQRYWKFDRGFAKPENIGEAANEVYTLLKEAIAACISDKKIAIELSGGLDSSGIGAIVKRVGLAKPDVVGISYDAASDDNSSGYTRAIADHLNIKEHVIFESDVRNPIADLKKSLDVIGYPVRRTFYVTMQGIYTAAKEKGVEVLFSGFGGDEVVSVNGYMPHLKWLTSKGKIKKAANLIRLKGHTFFKSYLSAILLFLKNTLRIGFEGQFVREEYLIGKHLAGNDKEYIPYMHINRKILPGIVQNAKHRIQDYHFTERLEAGELLMQQYQIKYRHPLLYVPLIEYFLNIPDDWKVSHPNGRAIFRLALKGALPQSFLDVKKDDNSHLVAAKSREIEYHYPKLYGWLLKLDKDHEFYNYISRSKLEKFTPDDQNINKAFNVLMAYIMLAMFFDKRRDIQLHEIG